MRYSPYVTYGHQGLILGQHPAQALSGNSSVLLDLQFLFKDHYSAKDYTEITVFFYPQTPPVEITQFQWFRQIIPIQTQIWRELRITSSCRCLPSESSTLNSLGSGASPCNSASKPEHWAGSSNWGRCCSTQYPFITGIIYKN